MDIPVAIRKPPPIGENDLDRHPSCQLDTVLAIARVHPVMRAQGESRADLGGFLTFQHRVGADAALALEGERLAVELAGQRHQSVELDQLLVIQPGIASDEVTLRIEDL